LEQAQVAAQAALDPQQEVSPLCDRALLPDRHR
jgi:hypothetical protein